MSNKKLLVVPMTLAMHTKLKWRAKQEGRSMSKVIRGLVTEYLGGETNPTSVKADGSQNDFYEELYEKVSRAVDS